LPTENYRNDLKGRVNLKATQKTLPLPVVHLGQDPCLLALADCIKDEEKKKEISGSPGFKCSFLIFSLPSFLLLLISSSHSFSPPLTPHISKYKMEKKLSHPAGALNALLCAL
jgi:hypothetical protein